MKSKFGVGVLFYGSWKISFEICFMQKSKDDGDETQEAADHVQELFTSRSTLRHLGLQGRQCKKSERSKDWL